MHTIYKSWLILKKDKVNKQDAIMFLFTRNLLSTIFRQTMECSTTNNCILQAYVIIKIMLFKNEVNIYKSIFRYPSQDLQILTIFYKENKVHMYILNIFFSYSKKLKFHFLKIINLIIKFIVKIFKCFFLYWSGLKYLCNYNM